ncbi:fungal-specific transcription factor domain-containing protein [Nemania sp. FL0916]|nr:fungal-specific transcription factor domain-containing protein [Nemania sp. FL0916]
MSATNATTAAAPHPKPTKILACVHCQYRKIKCDRQQPCSNCVKAKIACKPSVPAPPHKRRRPNQDLLERLARCEQLLKQYADGNVPPAQMESALAAAGQGVGSSSRSGNQAAVASTPALNAGNEAKQAISPTGKVVEMDGNVRFMDNYIRISFHDELAAMRGIIDNDGDDESESNTTGLSPDNNADLFMGSEDTAMDLQELQPDLVNVFRLWQVFIDRVNPLTKVVHIPSLQPYVIDSADNITKVPLQYQALLFAIYTMTVVAMTNEETNQLIGMNQTDALNQFARGTKLALMRANFLKNYNMTILQALVLYMLSLNGQPDQQSIWIMGGSVMRIAQQMGYHRDGEQFNLSPFETEMRRRIWWHVLTQDSRYAMMAGLSHNWVATNWDTKLPQNLNDEDLSPNSMKAPVPRNGPSDMAFVLLMYHYQKFASKTASAFESAFLALRGPKRPASQTSEPSPIQKYRELIEEIDAELAEFESKYVNPAAGGVQEVASMIRPLFVQKMRDVMIPMCEQPEYGTEIFDQTDSLFKSFVRTHRQNAAVFKRLSETGFLWFLRAGFHNDALLLFIAKLYKRPTGKLTDDAWTTLESIYNLHPDLFDVSQKKYDRQAQFLLKAWTAREQALAQLGQQVETPEFVQRLRALTPSSRTGSAYTASDSPSSATQQFFMPPTSTTTSPFTQQMSLDLADMNQYLGGGGVDGPSVGLDMWGTLMMDNDGDAQQQALPYGGFDFSKLDFSSLGSMRGSMG